MADIKRALFVLVLLASTGGCDRGPDGDLFIQRDSAGVLIVESSEPVWPERSPWVVGGAPVLDLTETGNGSDHEFYRVVDATRLADGSFAIANQGSRELRIFSPRGEFDRSVGKAGEGPGEFSRMASIGQLPDGSLSVFDSWLGRITNFSLDLDLIGTRSLLDQETRIVRLVWDEEGAPIGVGHSLEELARANGFYRITEFVTVVSEGDGGMAPLATLSGAEGFAFEYGDVQPLFPRSGHMAVGGTEVYLGEADALEVRVYSRKGDLMRVMKAPGLDLSLSPAEVEAERARLLSSDIPAPFQEAIRNLPAPATRPAYSDLLVDAEGYVWAPEARPPASEGAAITQVFRPDGRWLGSVEVPAGFRMMEIGSDYILGVHRDGLGVERVQVLSFQRVEP